MATPKVNKIQTRLPATLIRYGVDSKDYVYIFSSDFKGVMIPFHPEWVGNSLLGKVKSSKGVDFTEKVI
jgi:hypothetical protein